MSKPSNQESKRVLCLCRGGNSRSVGMATILKYQFGHDALAAGVEGNSKKTLATLCKWAELIICMKQEFVQHVPAAHQHKVSVCDVGHDRYYQGIHSDLVGQCHRFILARQLGRIVESPPKPKKRGRGVSIPQPDTAGEGSFATAPQSS